MLIWFTVQATAPVVAMATTPSSRDPDPGEFEPQVVVLEDYSEVGKETEEVEEKETRDEEEEEFPSGAMTSNGGVEVGSVYVFVHQDPPPPPPWDLGSLYCMRVFTCTHQVFICPLLLGSFPRQSCGGGSQPAMATEASKNATEIFHSPFGLKGACQDLWPPWPAYYTSMSCHNNTCLCTAS